MALLCLGLVCGRLPGARSEVRGALSLHDILSGLSSPRLPTVPVGNAVTRQVLQAVAASLHPSWGLPLGLLLAPPSPLHSTHLHARLLVPSQNNPRPSSPCHALCRVAHTSVVLPPAPDATPRGPTESGTCAWPLSVVASVVLEAVPLYGPVVLSTVLDTQ